MIKGAAENENSNKNLAALSFYFRKYMTYPRTVDMAIIGIKTFL